MDIRERPAGSPGAAAEVGLVVALVAAVVVTAFAISDTWGDGYWVFGCATGLAAGVLALARWRHRAG
ncbi:MAG: hypothetical protein HOV94_15420, partial [Saccharothrix sp.]|nr:hypothetical protein [Saccharothrix sp.]